MTDQLINELRQYLLTFDDAQKEQLKRNFSENNFQIIAGIEKAFLTDMKIGKIIDDFSLSSFQEEIRDLHAEFYLDLAECFSEGKTNTYIKHLLDTNNETFKKTVKMFPDESTFLRELSIAIDDNKTQKLVEEYAQVDEWLESKKVNKKAAASIIPVGRKIFHYAIAAAVVGVLISGAYLSFFNNKISNKELVDKKQAEIATIDFPNLIEHSDYRKSIIFDNRGSGLVGNISSKDSISIHTNGLAKQIDTLRVLLENAKSDTGGFQSRISGRISNQIESLFNVINTFTYDSKAKKIVLNIPEASILQNVISINSNDFSEIYIHLEGKYYLIKNTNSPLKLYPLKDKKQLERIKMIEFKANSL